ncbi:MAG: sterol desaturase family protein [Cyclobacteriaceae bacterium]|jgi:sterol desaturase/sphingolipid hydroxylase (fatty acid hydroxylase superfamily)|nr:sterol desaturase family protein [Cyclobacteriaceae bacterium]
MLPDRPLTLFLTLLARYVVVAGTAFLIFYVWLGKTGRLQKIQLRWPRPRDYGREVLYSLLTTLIFAGVGSLIFLTPFQQYTHVYTQVETFGLGYFVASIGVMLLVHDTYFYWTHRAMHHPRLFKWFHQVHHQSVNPSPWAAFAFHPLEAVVEAGIIFVIVFLIPVHPLAVAIFLLLMTVYNVYGHLGFELYPRWFATSRIGKWVNTSVNHNQHHHYFKGNYGLYFLWWDRWMGTLRADYHKEYERVSSRGQTDNASAARP